MRMVLGLAAAMAAASIQSAIADATIADACLKAAEFQFQVSDAVASDVQSFPELSPPRVRMRVSAELESSYQDAVAALLASEIKKRGHETTETEMRDFGIVMCEFTKASPPFGLTHFDCAGLSCFISDKRLEELQVMMTREGY